MSTLPHGWCTSPLESHLEFVIGGDWGKAPDFDDEDYKEVLCIRGSEFKKWQSDKGKTASLRKVKSSSLETRRLRLDDILVEISGGGPDQPVGRTVLIDEDALSKNGGIDKVCTNFLRLVRPADSINSKYLNYYLHKFYNTGEVARYQGGSNNLRNLKFKEYVTIPVPTAPLKEQIRIADKIDRLLAKVDAAQEHLGNIPTLLKRFRQSVLAAATSGELTRDWKGHPDAYLSNVERKISETPRLGKIENLKESEIELAKSLFGEVSWGRWKLFALEQLVEPNRGIPYGIVQTGDAQVVGIPTVRCGDVRSLLIRMDALKKVKPEIENKYTRTRLVGGEVLLAIRGTVGNAAVATKELAEMNANISREVAMIPVRKEINSHYIALLLQSPGGFKCLAEKVRGVAQKGINLADVKRFVTPLPSLEEQKEIVRRVESLFALAVTVEKQYLEANQRTNRLTQSLLAKAFRGELVPQDPTDEPASELLKRIQAELEAKAMKSQANEALNKTRKKNNTTKIKHMTLADAPNNYLSTLLKQLGGEAHAEVLWKKSGLNIDDFYAKLKQEINIYSIVDDNSSTDPSLRKLKCA